MDLAVADEDDDDEIDFLEHESAVQRQRWLSGAVDELRVRFHGCGYRVPDALRVSLGWPKGARGIKGSTDTIGQHFGPDHSEDQHHKVFISPVVRGEVRLVGILAHELVHAVMPVGEGHGRLFTRCATAVGLTGRMRATEEGEDFKRWVETHVLGVLGPYPAAPIRQQEKKQTTRLLKCACPTCGYPVRVTRQWLEQAGSPVCPVDLVPMILTAPRSPTDQEAAR